MLKQIVLIVAVIALGAHGLMFEIPATEKKCISEEVSKDVLVVGHYEAFPSYNLETDLHVFDPAERQIYIKRNINKAEKFAFTSVEAGDHSVCFVNRMPEGIVASPEMTRKIKLNILQGVDAKDYAEVAKKENLQPIEVQLKRMQDVVEEVHADMLYMRAREETHRNTNESTNARVAYFSIFSIIWLLGLGLWQVYYLKRYFRQKKLI